MSLYSSWNEFENSRSKTPISYFYDDVVRWEKGEMIIGLIHIIAPPDKKNYMIQHLVLNREWWNKLGSPNLFKLKFTD